jgi:hypothetical protein
MRVLVLVLVRKLVVVLEQMWVGKPMEMLVLVQMLELVLESDSPEALMLVEMWEEMQELVVVLTQVWMLVLVLVSLEVLQVRERVV